MKPGYTYRNSFVIEADNVTTTVDYYKDTSEEASNRGIVHDCPLKKPGILYALSSHFHLDHSNCEVLSQKEERPGIRYVFSKDILKYRHTAVKDVTYINKGDVYEDGHIRIEAFGPTDVGISFLIDLQGTRLFHAGDLNSQHWSEESTPQEICRAKDDFLTKIKILQQEAPLVDVAMFPVDSRVGKDYMRNVEQLVERIKTTISAPMHFSEDYRGDNSFRIFAESKGCRFLTISYRGESLDITK